MTHSVIERELKFDVPPDFVVPDVSLLLPEGGRTEMGTEQLRSDYFDTEDQALLDAHVTLRRRTGSSDVGWQLKVPHPPFRREIRTELNGHDTVPDELQRLLVGTLRGQALRPVASVRTERRVTRLLDAAGDTLAHIDDDTVHASATGSSATLSQWREVEVELGNDDTVLLDALAKRLRKAGARTSRSSSKLARAVAPSDAPPVQPKSRKRPDRAGQVISAYIGEQYRAILLGDLALRDGDDTVIHKTRVATRRLRSTLRTYGDLFDASRAAHLDSELRWYAALLGDVRDRQVLRTRIDGLIQTVDITLLLGPVRTRVDTELRREQGEHWQTLQEQLLTARYLDLLTDIQQWVARPPVTAAADRPGKTLARLLAQAEKKVTRRLKHANASGDLHQLHQARKAAKRARYAAEAAQPVVGAKAAARHAGRYQNLQDLLGEHQDSVVSADLLRRLGAIAGSTAGENGFAFGVLHEREMQAAQKARREARRHAAEYR